MTPNPAIKALKQTGMLCAAIAAAALDIIVALVPYGVYACIIFVISHFVQKYW